MANLSLIATPELDLTPRRVHGDTEIVVSAGVTVMAVDGTDRDTDTVIVIDRLNMCVKSFYKKDGTLHYSRLSLDSDPCGLAKLQNNQVAVTMPLYCKDKCYFILMVNVKPELEMLPAIKTSKPYFGITFLPPLSLAASSKEHPCVDILDMNGTVKSTIELGPGCRSFIIDSPNVLCTTTEGNILVSDGDSKRLVCLKPTGEKVFTYIDPDKAEKVPPTPEFDAQLRATSISTGGILVTDFTLNRVFHLTESGEFVGDILTDLMYPSGICEDGKGRVYVLSRGIKVFTPKRQ